MNIIDASDYSQWEATAIQVGEAAQTDLNKNRADRRYVSITYAEWKKVRNFRGGAKEKYILGGTPVKEVFFVGDTKGITPTLCDQLVACAIEEKEPTVGKPVQLDMEKVRAIESEELEGKLIRCGLKTMICQLRKGLCERNDVDGNVILTKQGDKIVADKITIIVQVARIEEFGDSTNVVYEQGYSPNEVLDREERRWWRKKHEEAKVVRAEDAPDEEQDPNKPPF